MQKVADLFVTLSEAAKLTNVTTATISRWITEGKLSVERIGRERVIPRAQVEELQRTRTLTDMVLHLAIEAGYDLVDTSEVLVSGIIMAEYGSTSIGIVERPSPGSVNLIRIAKIELAYPDFDEDKIQAILKK